MSAGRCGQRLASTFHFPDLTPHLRSAAAQSRPCGMVGSKVPLGPVRSGNGGSPRRSLRNNREPVEESLKVARGTYRKARGNNIQRIAIKCGDSRHRMGPMESHLEEYGGATLKRR